MPTLDPTHLASAEGPLRLVVTATLGPIAGLDRFQPAGFPEVGQVIYRAPRADGTYEPICIVDSPASMANHLESVCVRGPHDPELVPELDGMPYVRCVTDAGWPEVDTSKPKAVVVTSLTEGHRIASTYFLGGKRIDSGSAVDTAFEEELRQACGVLPLGKKKAHPQPDAWWTVFSTLFRYDPNALVHGVLFPQWQVKIPRALSAHLEALGAARVDRAGVKFDRLGKTTSGQPIFAVDEEVAREIKATFVLDLALVRSFGRDGLGLSPAQKAFLVGLALWKVGRLIGGPFRYRSGCDLECVAIEIDGKKAAVGDLGIKIGPLIEAASFRPPSVTDIYWPARDLYREGGGEDEAAGEEEGDSGENDE
jgi:CRISPR-associated protein Csb1